MKDVNEFKNKIGVLTDNFEEDYDALLKVYEDKKAELKVLEDRLNDLNFNYKVLKAVELVFNKSEKERSQVLREVDDVKDNK